MEVDSAAEGTTAALAEASSDPMATDTPAEPVANITNEGDSLEDILQTATAQVTQPLDITPVAEQEQNATTEVVKPPAGKQNAVVATKESATFNLGVPGLKFSSNNVKTAKDGTKMVQIHQSQITPDQLQALQNNPNIKVVFRHVPSGKSYMKPPKHLLPPGYASPIKKRKTNYTEEELEGGPDVYSFDEGEDFEGPTKRTKLADGRARYSYGGSAKKKGRPRVIPDSSSFASSFMNTNRQSSLPAKVILTDLLARVNNPNAKNEVKLHTSQVNAEVLANLELNPLYRIVLTTKQELPPLVIENVDAEEQAKLEKDAADIEKKENEEEKVNVEQETEEKMEEDVEQEEGEKEEENEEDQKRNEEHSKKEAERQKKEEEEELKKSVMQTQKSRSGRIRKPSRFSLDIARLTKRKNVSLGGTDSDADESEQESSAVKKSVSSPAKGRGRPKKFTSPPPPTKEVKEKEDVKPAEEKEKEDEKTEKESDKKEQEATESEKEVTSTENDEKKEEKAEEKADDDSKKDNEASQTEPDTSTDAVTVPEASESKPEQSADAEEVPSSKPDEEEPEIIDNKYRLRKLLEQCSTEEIRSVLLPEAFDSINLGDFLLYKCGQLHNTSGKISFPQLYKEFENLHKDATKEATRYNTLVRRANKVGGDKRMEKIVLMPVYNVDAANSLEISNSSIDAHICGIQRTITTEMIAANSFFIKTKMDSPLVRLKLPEVTAPKQPRPKQTRPLFSNQYQQPLGGNQQQEPDSTTPDKPKPQKRQTYGQKISSMKFTTYQGKSQNSESGIQVRRPAYFEQLKSTGQITLGGQNHQVGTKSQGNILHSIPVDSTSMLKADVQSSQMVASATSALAQLQATVEQQRQQQQAIVSTTGEAADSIAINPTTGQVVGAADTTLVTSDAAGQAEQFLVTEDGTPIAAATGEEGEVRKHLVPIGDGQYVELPEGYSLIQTDEGYIIGQPGSTFTQGEDGNVYITNSDGTTTEITQQDISGAGEAVAVSQVTEG